MARSSAHFKSGAPCIARTWLCASRDCFENASAGDDEAVLDGVDFSVNKYHIFVQKAVWLGSFWGERNFGRAYYWRNDFAFQNGLGLTIKIA